MMAEASNTVMRIARVFSGTAALLLLVAGCNARFKTVEVKGTVLLDGQPLTGATVLFMPEDSKGRAASGLTNREGSFLLTTYKEKDGALPGKYRVLITKTEAIAAPPAKLKPGDEKSVTEHYRDLRSRKNRKSNVPPLYGSEDTSPLECTVPPGKKVVFELSTKEAK